MSTPLYKERKTIWFNFLNFYLPILSTLQLPVLQLNNYHQIISHNKITNRNSGFCCYSLATYQSSQDPIRFSPLLPDNRILIDYGLVYAIKFPVLTVGILHRRILIYFRFSKKCLRELSQLPQTFPRNHSTLRIYLGKILL